MTTRTLDITGAYGPVTESVPTGDWSEVLFMADGSVRFAHDCRTLEEGLRLRCAPALQIGNGHTVVTREPLTIVASIACPDCGIHGWVTDGKWLPA